MAEGKPAKYETLSISEFISGYIKIMDRQKPDIKNWMSAHLADLMIDSELYRWEANHTFHAMWLQQLEQGRASWEDAELKFSYCQALVWHQLVPTSQQPEAAPAQIRKMSKALTPFNVMVKPDTKACSAYNRDGCTSAEQHNKEHHVCAYCL